MIDRLRTLTQLERLRRHEMAAEARELGDLRAHVVTLETTRDMLLEKLRTEARIITLEAAPYVGAYIRAIRAEEARINDAVTRASPRIAELETAMLARFRELATVRQALDQTKTAIHLARATKEARAADEHALIRWGRQNQGKTRS